MQCAQGGRKLTQFYREVRDIAGAAAPSPEKGGNQRGVSNYWRISQGLCCALYMALMCSAEKSVLQSEEQNRFSLVFSYGFIIDIRIST